MSEERMRQEVDKIIDFIVNMKVFVKDYGTDRSEAKDRLMAWARMWSGRPMKEEVMSVIQDWYNHNGAFSYGKISILANELLALYPSTPDPVSVSREAIKKVMDKYFINSHLEILTGSYADDFLNDLFALLSGQGRKRETVWCGHWEWRTSWNNWVKTDGSEQTVSPASNYCDLCGAKRPPPS